MTLLLLVAVNQLLFHGFSIEDGQDITSKVREFKQQVERAQVLANALPGTHLSEAEQLQLEKDIKKQIALKKELLEKYQQLCSFANTQQ
jgi:mediator of RNA polymerase II transcription subunit 9